MSGNVKRILSCACTMSTGTGMSQLFFPRPRGYVTIRAEVFTSQRETAERECPASGLGGSW
eukprot:6202724-Pleurochrysis_carterae.AAC.2